MRILIIIVNRHTYRKGPTLKGNIACVKKLLESKYLKVGVEIIIPMGRKTKLITMVGSKIPFYRHFLWYKAQGIFFYVIRKLLNQSKRPASSGTGLIVKCPKGIYNRKRLEFGNFRKTKVWGSRRIHNTAIICGKESSRFKINESWFESQLYKDHIIKLKMNIQANKTCNNLITILSNKEFLINCYKKIKIKPKNLTNSLNSETLDSIINKTWFEEVTNLLKNGSFIFKPILKTYTTKSRIKQSFITIPSLKDEIIHEGIRVLLELIFKESFRNCSHAFRKNRGYNTCLTFIKYTFSKSNWFIKRYNNDKQYFNIEQDILAKILRTKIQDELFIDLIYKYLNVGYRKKFNQKNSMQNILVQENILFPLLLNIYMNVFDEWVEDFLIPKYTLLDIKKIFNLTYKKTLIKSSKIAVKSFCKNADNNINYYSRVFYVRYADEFIIGLVGSKKLCSKIINEIKVFLKKKLLLNLNIEKTKITHATTEKVLFLGYEIKCTPNKKITVNSIGRFSKNTNNTQLMAPIKQIIKLLQNMGFVSNKGKPTRNKKFINYNLWNIIENYKAIEHGILNYYKLANNYKKLAVQVHYILKYSCALTISSKIKLKTLKGVFKRYGKNLSVDRKGKTFSYPKVSYRRPLLGSVFIKKAMTVNELIENLTNRYISRHIKSK